MRTIRWGIIGCGQVCEVKSAPALMRARGSVVTAVMRRDGAKARAFAKRFGIPAAYDDAAALLADPKVDAVYIATPPHWHKHYTLMAAAAGKPVLVEKPMAMNAGEAEEMVAACAAARMPLFVNHFRRAMPRFIEAKARIDSGVLGEIRCATVAFSTPGLGCDPGVEEWRLRSDRGGNKFFDIGCHHLDLLDYLLGPIADARAHLRKQAPEAPSEDLYTASLRFHSGAQAAGAWCYSAGITTDLVEIVGSRGVLAFPVFDFEAPLLLETEELAEEITVVPELYVHLPFIQTVVDMLNGQGESPSTGDTALRTMRVLERILSQTQT
jgi:1,5-anhydro-D-fructose reductase (1,5-anhydro-D-mannitol-forming)